MSPVAFTRRPAYAGARLPAAAERAWRSGHRSPTGLRAALIDDLDDLRADALSDRGAGRLPGRPAPGWPMSAHRPLYNAGRPPRASGERRVASVTAYVTGGSICSACRVAGCCRSEPRPAADDRRGSLIGVIRPMAGWCRAGNQGFQGCRHPGARGADGRERVVRAVDGGSDVHVGRKPRASTATPPAPLPRPAAGNSSARTDETLWNEDWDPPALLSPECACASSTRAADLDLPVWWIATPGGPDA